MFVTQNSSNFHVYLLSFKIELERRFILRVTSTKTLTISGNKFVRKTQIYSRNKLQKMKEMIALNLQTSHIWRFSLSKYNLKQNEKVSM